MSDNVYPLAGALLIGFSLGCLVSAVMVHIDAWAQREVNALCEDALTNLVDTDLEPAHKPLSMSPAARRIRETDIPWYFREDEVRKFREEMDAWDGGAA